MTRHSADFLPSRPDPGLRFTARTWPSHARDWTVADFHGAQAPTSLDGTSVTIGGQTAFLSYISPNQINAQVPSGVGLGPQDVRVTTAGRNQRSPDDYRESNSTGLARSRCLESRRQAIHRSAVSGRNHLRPPGRSDAQWDRSACPPRGDDRSLRRRVWHGHSGPRRGEHRRRTTTAWFFPSRYSSEECLRR